jgi:hypothetical protein
VDITAIFFEFTPTLLVHPLAEVGFDELLDACAAAQAHPEGALFPSLPQIEVEERTAEVFVRGPFGDQAEGRGVRGKLELVTVEQRSAAVSAERLQAKGDSREIAGPSTIVLTNTTAGTTIEVVFMTSLYGLKLSLSQEEKL